MIKWDKDKNNNIIEYEREDGRIENRGRDGNIEYRRVDNIIIGLLIENNSLPQSRIDKIFNYTSLEELRLVNCNIMELSSKISKLSKLKILNLEKNKLEEIPSTIGTLRSLEELNLSQNNIQKLPKQFEKLQNLISLNLFENKEIEINESILKLKQLEFLNLGLTNVDKIIDRMNEFPYLKELNLSEIKIYEIPKSLYSLKKLEKLSLKNNNIKEIPNEIELLESLKVLDVQFNQIEKISKRIMNLNLSELFLKNNPFLIFEELSSADWKQSLNELFNIHEDYQELKKINLSGLGLTYIPNLSYFKDIEILDLSRNKIEVISQNIIELSSLKELDLGSNKIGKIPQDLNKLIYLKKLNLIENDVSDIKGFSLKESPKEIIDFLLLNQNKEMTPLNEAKLLIVGDENSGKSSLVERMVKNQFNPQYNSTQGIDISHYPISSDIVRSYCFGSYVEPNIKVNIWDFAGQEITYQVHNLFMSKESLYLLVIDGQKEDNIVENFDWLETISANASNPPIIIVITKHENNRSHEIDEARYREEFPNIEAIEYISSKENIGFCELKQSILLSISRFGKQKIPKDYKEVKNKIEEKKTEKLKQEEYMLSADDFDNICKKSNLFEEKDNIRTIFNDIGVLIGLNNDDMHVVNPSKMIDKIYKIIRSKEIADNGELDIKKDNDRHYTWIMQFLLKNKIAFQLNDSKVMIPSRLSVKRPKGFSKNSYMRDDKVYGLNFRYKYKRFKKGIFFDFLIKVLNIDELKSTYWANGITWNFDEFKVAVLASKVDRTIDIHISKETEKSKIFLTKIRKKLEIINREHRGMIEEIGVVDESDDTLHYKSYRFLKEKKKKNQRTKGSDVELDIRGNPKDFPLVPLLEKYEFVEEEAVNDGVKPLILTEGKTDIQILDIAWSKLYPDKKMPFQIDDAGKKRKNKDTAKIEKSGSADILRQQLEFLTTSNDKLIIGIFDNDLAGIRAFGGLQKDMFGKLSKNAIERKHMYSNTYAILLPVPDFRNKFMLVRKNEFKVFEIEHYFSDEVLRRYEMKGEDIIEGTEIFEIQGNKNKFSKSLEDLEREEFKHFKLLFDMIKRIIKDS